MTPEKKLLQAKRLIEEALVELGALASGEVQKKTPSASVKEGSLSDHILTLKATGFFKQPRISEEVHAELQTVYPCEKKRVRVELIRLNKKKELRKATKEVEGKKLIAYVH